MSLSQLISRSASHADIASYLDALAPGARRQEVLALRRKQQRDLFQRVADGPPITLEHFVPEGIEPLREVIHYGKNTIPVPHGFRHFQKRFCLPQPLYCSGRESRLFGYNEGFSRRFIGPGYFVAEATAGRSEWASRGGVVVDYFQIPNQHVPATWPRVVPNRQGLQRFVFDQTRDFMRKVSDHVSIGAAYRQEKALGFYFVLCREIL